MTPERLEEIRKRAEAATKGPWGSIEEDDPSEDYRGAIYWETEAIAGSRPEHPPVGDCYAYADALFCAHAREDVPDLLAEVDELAAHVQISGDYHNEVRRHLAEVGIEAVFVDDAAAIAAAEIKRLRAEADALEAALRAQDPRNATALYDRIADAFYRETRLWPPVRSRPLAMGGGDPDPDTHRKWREFCNCWHERHFDEAYAIRKAGL